ncbi:MAG: UvrD-helicase domain-containing protein [Crocinitomicaceae bacterium]|nr:UvrD-helicase domain-containing protein [Crocinitomicaceae bacterium]
MSCIFEKTNKAVTNTTRKPLKILNASAGSGKTYHLVKEYVKLLIRDDKATSSFANVIAMTFTNKAALEMKERIITALDTMSSPDFFENKAIHLTNELSTELAISPVEVEKRCKKVLEAILHQYEDFHVMTIDKFNLRLIKSFGRDLDLPNDFEVVMDESELIEKIVDDLLNQLGEEGSKELNKLIFYYARTNVADGNQWNFRRALVDFGKILRNERNNDIVEKLLEMDFSVEQFGSLKKERNRLDDLYLLQASKLKSAVDNEQLSADTLPGKSTTYKGISKLYSVDAFPVKSSLVTDSFLKNMDAELKPSQHYPASVKQEIRTLISLWEGELKSYVTLDLFMKNFFNMALLQYMAGALKKVRKDEQLIRISEFNTLISDLIQNESTPFIYERLGTKFHHFLLDEFQDTSHLQWLNLVPLVHESLGHRHENLIVGDPKQSIYRFKNGVAEQFVALPEIYNPNQAPHIAQKSAYFSEMGSVSELENNWRSSPSIVQFNNSFFKGMRDLLPESTANFYNSIEQFPKSTVNGRIQIVSKPEKKTSDELLPMILKWVEECRTAGFNMGDICILGGTNRECNRWALGLNDEGYNVVSTDSLLINSNLKVQLTIAYLKRRLRPSGENEMKRFAELFFRIRSGSYADYKRYIIEKETEAGKKYREFNDEAFLSDHFNGTEAFFFKHENIYDLIQQFYALIGYDELNDPYLHHLADIAFDYGLSKGPDLKAFLSDYETKKNKIAVQIPESDDAIQLMTIHKSKGLEFPVVIIPSMNFSGDVKSHFLVNVEDFVVYKRPTQSENISILQDLYTNEKEQIIADNVNKCYVAMTRPIERLYVGNYFEPKSFGKLFHDVITDSGIGALDEEEYQVDLNDGERSFKKSSANNSSIFSPVNIQDRLWFPDIALQDSDDLTSNDYLSQEMQFGIEFHLMASRIENKEDIKETLESAVQLGEVSTSNTDDLEEKLIALFDLESYQQLFEGAKSVLNEQTILLDANSIVRPDKIVVKENETIIIDYKTGIPSAKDQKQVNQYKMVMLEMGYPNISCYLFYSSIGELRLV